MFGYANWGLLIFVICLTAFGVGKPRAEIIRGYPDALVCQVENFKVIIYIHRIQEDGSAIFMTQGGEFVQWKKDGTVIRNNKPFKGCQPHTFGQ
ncbi:MAG: hypothetical protein ACR2PG_02220 [Hyphomicrobiaceae bacterium]